MNIVPGRLLRLEQRLDRRPVDEDRRPRRSWPHSGSALKQSVGGKGYGPGIQAWYNQFLTVDPANPKHVYAGLEEVYETKDAGASWTTPGPYWNFYFGCWDINDAQNSCPSTSHPDQHAAAIGTVGNGADVLRRQRRRHLQPAGQRPGQLRRARHRLEVADHDGDDRRAAVLLGGLGRGQAERRPGRVRRPAGQRRLQPARRASQWRELRHQDGLALRRRRWRRAGRPGRRLPTGAGVRLPVDVGDRELRREPWRAHA